mgnify:CR=1 FL=1
MPPVVVAVFVHDVGQLVSLTVGIKSFWLNMQWSIGHSLPLLFILVLTSNTGINVTILSFFFFYFQEIRVGKIHHHWLIGHVALEVCWLLDDFLILLFMLIFYLPFCLWLVLETTHRWVNFFVELTDFLLHFVCLFVLFFQGSFAGLAIMFVTPGLLVLYSRDRLDKTVPHWRQMHPHISPFQHQAWVYLMLMFAAFVLITRIF